MSSERARHFLASVAFWAACGSAVAVVFSIAISQILLGVSLCALLLGRCPIKQPRALFPLAAFLLLTVASLLASGDLRAGLPQVRKLYVYLTLPIIFSVVGHVWTARNLLLAWCAGASLTSLIGITQFVQRYREAQQLHRNFYEFYLNGRITGTMGHWMTFSGEEMLVLLILVAYLLFGTLPRKGWWIGAWIVGVAAMGTALLLSDTRSVWIASFVALIFLAWHRSRLLVLVIPVLAIVAFAAAPSSVRARAESIVRPRKDVDSNDFRFIVWRTGLRMIEAHPLLGLGPEQVHQQFFRWVPPDIPRPLPPGYYGHLHSIYVHYAAERGIPALLALLAMLGLIVFDCARALRRLPKVRGDTRFILLASIACVLAISVEGAFELNLGDSEVLTMFLVITACAYVAIGSLRTVEATTA